MLRLNGDRLCWLHIWLFNGQIWVQRETPGGRFTLKGHWQEGRRVLGPVMLMLPT